MFLAGSVSGHTILVSSSVVSSVTDYVLSSKEEADPVSDGERGGASL
jgi:hypothetical protein